MPLIRYNILLICLLCAGFSYSPVISSNGQMIYPGVSVQGIELGGKTINEVYHLLTAEKEKIGSCKIILHLPDGKTKQKVSFREMGVEVDKSRIWQEAFAQGRSGTWWEKLRVRWFLKRKGVNLPLYLTITPETAKNILEEVGKPWYIPSQDARFEITAEEEVLIHAEKIGERIALDTAIQTLQQKLLMNLEDELNLYLSLEKIQPLQIRQDLESYGISTRLSSFSTWFNSANVNRTKNIKLAVQELSLVLLAPDEVFSFNELVGPRTKERGYDEAEIIQNYHYILGIGGGICQVSSTVYNAVLLANLEVVERYPHSMIINYVQPGLDATVVYGSRDFRFRNNTGCYLLIKVTVSQGKVICKIFGQPEQKKKVILKTFLEREIEPSIIYQEDPFLSGDNFVLEREGVPGRVVRVERHIYDLNGELLKTEIISKDIYPPVDKVIRSSTDPQSMSISEVL